jgi:hypothetical protein
MEGGLFATPDGTLKHNLDADGFKQGYVVAIIMLNELIYKLYIIWKLWHNSM